MDQETKARLREQFNKIILDVSEQEKRRLIRINEQKKKQLIGKLREALQ